MQICAYHYIEPRALSFLLPGLLHLKFPHFRQLTRRRREGFFSVVHNSSDFIKYARAINPATNAKPRPIHARSSAPLS